MTNLENTSISAQTNKFELAAEQQDTAVLLDRLLGKAISDRYIDFCRLSAGAFNLRVASPMAAHALREPDSILRQTLGIPLQAIVEPTEGETARIKAAANVLRDMGFSEDQIEHATDELMPKVTHKDQIRKVVSRLGLAEDGDIAKAWIAVSPAHKKAHERRFNRALMVDDDFRANWAEPFDMVVRGVAVALQGSYTTLTARVEQLATMTDKARALTLFEREIPGALSLQWHFFRNIHGPAWLPELIQRSLIVEPPYPPEETKGTLLRQWPIGRYLLDVAKSDDAAARGLVIHALRGLADATHPDVRRDALEIVAALPADEAARIADLVACWLGHDDFIFGTHFAEEIVKRFAEAGEKDACLTVARGLYHLSHDERRILTSFTAHMYEHSVFKMTPMLTHALGLDALQLFSDLLYEAAVITEKIGVEPRKDHTTFSSLPLPRTEADQHDVYGALTAAALRSSSMLIEEEKIDGSAIINILFARPYRIYQRIAMNALAIRSAAAPAVADELLLNPDLLESSSLSHEYAALAISRFPAMSPAKQQELLAMVDAVPGKYMEFWRGRFTDHEKRPPNEEEIRDYVGATLRDLTWYWREVLPADRQKALTEYVERRGDPDAWRNVFSSPAEESPLNPSDFAGTEAKDIANYLRTWAPSPGATKQTKTALAYELRKAVEQNPNKFSLDAMAFADLPPLYARRFLEGLHQSVQKKAPIVWAPVLDMIEHAVANAGPPEPNELSQGGDDPSPFWAAKEAVELVRACLQRGDEIIGYEHMDHIGSIVRLVEAIAPDAPELSDFEERYARSPYFAAEVTMVGLAAELNVLFLYWLSKHKDSSIFAKQREAMVIRPAFPEYAERALDYDGENGRIVRAVLGRYLTWLIYFGEDWVKTNFAKIFPSDQLLREAAWLGHLLHDSRPARDFVPQMRPLYEAEIARLGEGTPSDDRDQRQDRCGEYLAVLYLWGVLPEDLQEALLTNASTRLRRHIMWFMGRELKSLDLPEDVRARVLAYWETRLAAAIAATDKDDFREELGTISMWDSVAAADVGWLLAQQTKMYSGGYAPNNAYSVMAWAAKVVDDHPDKTVEMTGALLKNPKTDHWAYTANHEPVRKVLSVGLAKGSAETAERVRQIVSFLASAGDTSFLDLAKTV